MIPNLAARKITKSGMALVLPMTQLPSVGAVWLRGRLCGPAHRHQSRGSAAQHMSQNGQEL